MPNPLATIESHIRLNIPEQILRLVFANDLNMNNNLMMIIRDKIIAPIVLPACNQNIGIRRTISLSEQFILDTVADPNLNFVIADQTIFKIPPVIREYRPITAILNINIASPGYGFAGGGVDYINYQNSVNSLSDQVLNSYTLTGERRPMGFVLNQDDGIIKVVPSILSFGSWIATCLLGIDKDLTNLPINLFNKMKIVVEYALKQYIYNTLIIPLSQGMLEGGMSLDAIVPIINEYSNSYAKFEEALVELRGASTLSVDNIGPIAYHMF